MFTNVHECSRFVKNVQEVSKGFRIKKGEEGSRKSMMVKNCALRFKEIQEC